MAWLVINKLPDLRLHLRIRQAEAQCARYTASPDLVVYEDDPAQVAKLQGNANYTVEQREVDPPSALFHAPCLTALDRWTNKMETGLRWPASTVFLHELQAKDGTRRLVQVAYSHSLAHSAGHDSFFLYAAMLDTTKNFNLPTWVVAHQEDQIFRFGDVFPEGAWDEPAYLTIYAGQMDSFDPARFSIRCRLGQQDGFIDGWLEDTSAGPALHLIARCRK